MDEAELDRGQVLNELEFLATVEHALVVEYLSVQCAFGHDLPAAEGGASTKVGFEAASVAFQLAVDEMLRLRSVNLRLIAAQRAEQLGRATSVPAEASAQFALGPPSLAQLEQLTQRGHAVAVAVDQRYRRLAPAVTTHPVFDGALLDDMHLLIVEAGPAHADTFASLLTVLGDTAPGGLLRATRREAADSSEQRLLNVSDRCYRLVLAAVRGQLTQDTAAGEFRGLAFDAMMTLDEINRELAGRGLLPPFTLR